MIKVMFKMVDGNYNTRFFDSIENILKYVDENKKIVDFIINY